MSEPPALAGGEVVAISKRSVAASNDRETTFIHSVATPINPVATSKRPSPAFTHREVA